MYAGTIRRRGPRSCSSTGWGRSGCRESPSVRRAPAEPTHGSGPYDELEAEELIALVPSLEAGALRELRELEAAGAARPPVLTAIDAVLARQDG